jgi:uncharacterized membrane protein AbrB (regulator of aidB expression)
MILVTSLVAAVGAALLLDRLNFPAGALIGAMVAIAALKLLGNETRACRAPFGSWRLSSSAGISGPVSTSNC